MLTFAIEPLIDVWPELVELYLAQWNETEAYRHGQPFDPRLERYMEYEQIGWYVLFTARDGEKLVGNIGMYLTPSMHTQQLIATEDTLFLLKEYRKGRNAITFIKFVETEAWRRGAVELMISSKNDKTGRLMEHLDFQPVAVQYSKSRAAPTVHNLTVVSVKEHSDAEPPPVRCVSSE
jgi:hypothetical protein